MEKVPLDLSVRCVTCVQVCEHAFALVKQRVVVNGIPWNASLKDEGLTVHCEKD